MRDFRSIPLTAADDPEFSSKLLDISHVARGTPKLYRSKNTLGFRRPQQKVGDQGNVGSCVGWTLKTVLQDSLPSPHELSALWIYHGAKKNDSTPGVGYSGTTISGACRSVSKDGVCLATYEKGEGKFKVGAGKDASNRKISGHSTVRAANLQTIKDLLRTQSLATSIHIHEEFYNINSEGFLNDGEYLKSPKKGGHAVALVGWTTRGGKCFLRFQNSWSKAFGLKGDFFLSHELFQGISKGVYVTHRGELTLIQRALNLADRLKTRLVRHLRKYF